MQRFGKLRNHWYRLVPRERDNLADDGVFARISEVLGRRIRANKRDVHKRWIEFHLAGQLEEFGNWLVGTDHHHCVGFGLADGQ